MTPPCFICRRTSIHGLTYNSNPVCAMCAPYSLGGEMMLSFPENEVEALDAGGAIAGGYLDEIGKTDLATLSEVEWATFLGHVLEGYSEAMRGGAKAHPPF